MGNGTTPAAGADDSVDLQSILTGQAALDNAAAAAPGLGSTFGASAVQGAISAVTPYLPYIAIGVVALVIMLGRR